MMQYGTVTRVAAGGLAAWVKVDGRHAGAELKATNTVAGLAADDRVLVELDVGGIADSVAVIAVVGGVPAVRHGDHHVHP